MKLNFKRIGKRALSAVLSLMMAVSMVTVGMVSTSAVTVKGGTFYFDNSLTGWTNTNIFLCIGKGDYTSTYKMTKVSGSSLYVYDHGSSSWDGATYIAVIAHDGDYGEGKWGSSNLTNAAHNTAAYTNNYTFESGSSYVITPTNSTDNTQISITYYGSLSDLPKYTQTLKTKVNGTVVSQQVATLKIKSAYYATNGFTQSDASSTAGTATWKDASKTATTTLSYSSLSAGYTFEGWYNASGTRVSTSATYTYSVSGASTYYANFTKAGYSVTCNTATNGTVTVNKTSAPVGETVTITATPNEGYVLDTITVTDADGADITVTNNQFTMPGKDVTVTATFKPAQTYSITTDDARLTIKDSSNAVITSAYEGKTVYVYVSGLASNERCRSVKYTANGTTKTATYDSAKSAYCFAMPADDTTVSAEITELQACSVYASSAGNGTVTVSPSSTVVEGDTVTLTATADSGFFFDNWIITGPHSIKSGSTSTATVTITVNGDINATANFRKGKYYLQNASQENNKDYPLVLTLTQQGVYISSNKVTAGSSFTIYNESQLLSASTASITKTGKANGKSGTWVDSNPIRFKNDTGSDAYVYFDGTNVWLSTINQGPAHYKIYAKDGSTRGDGSSNKYGDTVLTSGFFGSRDGQTYYGIYDTAEGQVVSIKTTISSSYYNSSTGKGFYVSGYCVNGETVKARETAPGVYEGSFVVDGTKAINNKIEITPVYFDNRIPDADYITFYMDASEVVDTWGKTMGIYPYYYKNGIDNEGTNKNYGDYPGQPMLLGSDGLYYTKIAKYYYGSTGVKETEYALSGIVISNMAEGDLHGDVIGNSTNYQTYDYHDLIDIANAGYDTIKFEAKYRKKLYNKNESGLVTTIGGTFGSTQFNTYKNGNGWDILKNYSRDDVDVFNNLTGGTPVSGTTTYNSNAVYIVSTGNYDTRSVSDATTKGRWTTRWYVYADGKLVAKANPSSFIKGTSAYESLKTTLSAYEGRPTYITYEEERMDDSDGTQTGVRSDGRWLYTMSTAKVKPYVSIQYTTDDGKTYTTDTNVNAGNETTTVYKGTVTGATASIGSSNANFATISCDTSSTQNLYSTSSDSMWIFDGWYVADNANGDNAKRIEGYDANDMNPTGLVIANSNHYIARFKKATTGALEISHTKYGGTYPSAHDGSGTYYLGVSLIRGGNTTEIASAETNVDKVKLDTILPTDMVQITLRTICDGKDQFVAWLEAVGAQYQIVGPEYKVEGTTGELSYTFTVYAAQLFDVNGKQTVNALSFYSDIKSQTANARIVYKYLNRFDMMREYVVVIPLDNSFYNNSTGNYSIDNEAGRELIKNNAPAIDELYKHCIWNIENADIDGVNAELTASQPPVTYTVKIKTSADGQFKSVSGIEYNSYLTDPDKNNAPFFPEGEKFSYWVVYDAETTSTIAGEINVDGAREVAKCYTERFALKIVDDYVIVPVFDAGITNSVTISEAFYTREQFTNDDGTVKTDYLYADFIVSFMSDEYAKLMEDTNEERYQTGLLITMDPSVQLQDADISNNKANYSGDQYKYNITGSADTERAKLEEIAKSCTKGITTIGNQKVNNLLIDNANYNNFNRLDYYVRYTNNENNQRYIMKAFYYVYDKDTDTVYISDAVYFNLYDIAHIETNTGNN
ncbi:MAG: hypothetical protein U0L20_00825 [Ruminococcus sp.]|nr:hypothetical protein [Ruminococcus sp.]